MAIIAIDMKTWENVLLGRFYDDDYQKLAYLILILKKMRYCIKKMVK
jgi:hypothetical protein